MGGFELTRRKDVLGLAKQSAAVRNLTFARPSLGQLDTNDGGESRRHPSRSQELVPIPLSSASRRESQTTDHPFLVFVFGREEHICARGVVQIITYVSISSFFYIQNIHSRSFQFQFQLRSKPTSRPAFLTTSPASGQTLSTRSYSLSLLPLPIGGRNSVVYSVSVSTRSVTFLPRGESYLEASTVSSVGNLFIAVEA